MTNTSAAGEPKADASGPRKEADILRDKLKLYDIILNRYRTMIERSESKTIADLKALIQPKDETVVRVKDQLIDEFKPYLFEKHFYMVAERAHKFVSEMKTVKTPVDFWLTSKEFLELKGGDMMDKAVFLCSLLIALENNDAYVIVGVDGGTKIAVGHRTGNGWRFLDPTTGTSINGDKDALIKQWFAGAERMYEFNDREYNQLSEE